MLGIRRLGMTLAFSIICGSAMARADTMLRYQFKEGETLPYTMEQKMKMTMNVGGMDVAIDMTQTIDMSWHVKSVDKDGKAKMVEKFDRVRFTMNSPMGKMEYDSKDGKQPEGPIGKVIGPMLEALAGAEFSSTMDARGQISDVTIPEKLSQAFRKLPGGGLGGGGDLFSEEGIKHMVTEAGLILPEGPATKGKSWNREIALKMPYKMKLNNLNTYEGPTTRDGKELERIALKPKMTIEAGDNPAISLKIKSQEANGTAYFDNKAGRLVETKMTQTMEMEVSLMGQTINQKMEQNVTFKLNDKAK